MFNDLLNICDQLPVIGPNSYMHVCTMRTCLLLGFEMLAI